MHAKAELTPLHGRIVEGCVPCVVTRQSVPACLVMCALPETVSDEALEHEYAASEVAVVETEDRLDTVMVTTPDVNPVNLDSEEAVITALSAVTLPKSMSDLLLTVAAIKGTRPLATVTLDADEEVMLMAVTATSSVAIMLPPAEARIEPATLSTVTWPPVLAATYAKGSGTVRFTTVFVLHVPGQSEMIRVPQASTCISKRSTTLAKLLSMTPWEPPTTEFTFT